MESIPSVACSAGPRDTVGQAQQEVALLRLDCVGLPLATAIADRYTTIGYDPYGDKIRDYRTMQHPMREVSQQDSEAWKGYRFATDHPGVGPSRCNPRCCPDADRRCAKAQLRPPTSASKTAGTYMTHRAIVVCESTAYPGAT